MQTFRRTLFAAASCACLALADPASAASGAANTTEPSSARPVAQPFFHDALEAAKQRLDSDGPQRITAIPVSRAADASACPDGGAPPACVHDDGSGDSDDGTDIDDDDVPVATMADTTATCGEVPTCRGWGTCTGSATVCSNTCSGYPTCFGIEATWCQHTCKTAGGQYPTCSGAGTTNCGQSTCMNYPTCSNTGTCTSTCNGNPGYPTCSGTVATSCSQTCGNYPTCYTTCTRYATCQGTATCTSTCNGSAPTCSGGTCNGSGSCHSTCTNWQTCNGTPPSYCASTCSANPNCAVSQSVLASLDGPQAPLLMALASVLVLRRRKAAKLA